MRLWLLAALSLVGCSNPDPSCTGCADVPARICHSACLTRIEQEGGTTTCECIANDCSNMGATYALVCDDNFCQCSASGAAGNAGGQFPAPQSVCESDVSVIAGLFDNRCRFPPK